MEHKKRLIDANALLEAIDKSDKENFHKGVANRSIHHYEHRHFMNMVLNAPTVDAVEVVHGRWAEHRPNVYECTACHVQYSGYGGCE